MNAATPRSTFFFLSFGYMAIRFLLGIGRTRILTEVLPKELYGGLTLTVTTVTFAALLLSLGTFEFLVRTLPGREEREQRAWLHLLLRRLAQPVWGLTGVAMIALWAAGLLGGLSLTDLFLLWPAFGLTFWLLYRTFFFLGSGQLVKVRLVQLFQHDLWFVGILFSMLWLSVSFTQLLTSWVVWLFLLAVMVSRIWYHPVEKEASPGTLRDAVRFGFPLMPMIAADALFRMADRYALLGYTDLTAVAEYTLCMNIAMIVYLVGASLLDLNIPVLNEMRNEQLETGADAGPSAEMKKVFSRMIRHVLCLAIPAAAAMVLMAPDILGMLSGKAFHDAAPLLVWMCLAPAFFLLATVFSRALLAMDCPRWVGGSTFAMACLNAVLNIALIPICGVPGAALATTISLGLLAVVAGWKLRVFSWVDSSVLYPVRLLVLIVLSPTVVYLAGRLLGGGMAWLRLGVAGVVLAGLLLGLQLFSLSEFQMVKRVGAVSADQE